MNASIQRTQTAKMYAEIMLHDASIPIRIDQAPVLFYGQLTIELVRMICLCLCKAMKEEKSKKKNDKHCMVIEIIFQAKPL